MSLMRWNPIRELQEMNEMVDRFFGDTRRATPGGERVRYRIPMDAYMTDDALIITLELPGVNEDDVNITLENGVLNISGEMKPRKEDRDYLVQERFHGRFERALSVSTPVQVDKAEAVFNNGVLTLTLPKAEEVKPKQITVKRK